MMLYFRLVTFNAGDRCGVPCQAATVSDTRCVMDWYCPRYLVVNIVRRITPLQGRVPGNKTRHTRQPCRAMPYHAMQKAHDRAGPGSWVSDGAFADVKSSQGNARVPIGRVGSSWRTTVDSTDNTRERFAVGRICWSCCFVFCVSPYTLQCSHRPCGGPLGNCKSWVLAGEWLVDPKPPRMHRVLQLFWAGLHCCYSRPCASRD